MQACRQRSALMVPRVLAMSSSPWMKINAHSCPRPEAGVEPRPPPVPVDRRVAQVLPTTAFAAGLPTSP